VFCRMGGGEWRRLRSSPRNMLWLCHISVIDIEYTECRCAGGGIPVAARRAIPWHTRTTGMRGYTGKATAQARRPSPAGTRHSVPRSSERLIWRCRGQIGPESDGRLRRAHDRIRQAATLASPGMVLLCLLLRDSPTSISRVRGPNRRPLARQKHLGEPR